MESTSNNLAKGIDEVLEQMGDMLFRICFVYLRNEEDVKDAVQDTLMKYLLKSPQFEEKEHEKAWLIRVATNRCKDMLRERKHTVSLELQSVVGYTMEDGHEALKSLMLIPDIYRLVLELHYVEGYQVKEIAKMLGKSESAVKMRLKRGRDLLEKKYRKEYGDGL